jgi:phage gpG-like protein
VRFSRALNKNNFNTRILYPAKQSFKIDGAIKVFHDKQKLQQYMTTKTPLQKILQGILHTKVKPNITMKGQAVPHYRKRKSKKVVSNINLTTHNQTLQQLRQLNDRNHHISVNTNT